MVLDGVDGTSGSPVDGGWDVDGGELGLLKGDVLWGSVSEESLVLSIGPGGELVVSNGEGVLWVGVDLIVLLVLSLEDGLSELVLFGGSEVESLFSDVFHELGVLGFHGVAHVLHVEGGSSDLAGGEHLVKVKFLEKINYKFMNIMALKTIILIKEV